MTLLAGSEFSEACWEIDSENVAERLLTAASPWLNSPAIDDRVHRWRYSQPRTLYGEPFLALPEISLVLAGDAFVAPNVEGAVLSGLAAAEYLLS